MIKKRSDDHVRIDSYTSTMNCEHCGASEGLNLPLSVQLVVKRTGVFLRKHRKCPAPKWTPAEESTARAMHRLLGPGNALRRRYVLLADGNILDSEGLGDLDLERHRIEALNSKPETAAQNRERFSASIASARRVREAAALKEANGGPAKPPALPRAKPCGSCPYRRDVPAGVWAPEEYAKLPRYDAETFAQPVAPFFCHSQDGTLCAGWLGCADPSELLAVRLGVSSGRLDPSALDYSTDVPLFGSGTEAAEHGASGVKRPSKGAREVIRKLERAKRIKAKRPAR